MTPFSKKRLLNVIRIALCVAALAIVVQGVTIHDHVVPADGSPDIVGCVTGDLQADGHLVVVLPNGEQQTVAAVDIAADSDGVPCVSFGLKTSWRKSSKWLLLLAVAIHFPVILPQSLRLQWLLRAQDIRVGYWECLKLSFAGNFLNFATPLGSNAGDVFKAYFVSLHTEHKTEAVTTVLLDRVVGLSSLLLIVATITTFCPAGSRLADLAPYFLSFLGAGVVGGLIYLSPVVREHLLPRKWLSRLPAYEQLQRVDKTARVLFKHKAILTGAMLLTILLQIVALGAYFTVAVALALDANLGNVLEYYASFFTGILVQTLPGPPQGLGTVELTYRYFLAPFGSPSQIVCVAFFIRLVAMTCALPGLLVTATGSYKPGDVVAAESDPPAATGDRAASSHELAPE